MRAHVLLFFVAVIFYSCNSPYDRNKPLIQFVKENSLYSDSLDWSLIEEELKELPVNQDSLAVKFLIGKLETVGDFHAHYFSKESAIKMAKENLDSLKPHAKYLGDSIAYIEIPRFQSVNTKVCESFANQIQSLIRSLDTNLINGWIIDLRENNGGNMAPMIAGLGPLTGEGNLGYFIDRKSFQPWAYKNGVCEDVKVANPYSIKNKEARIAILISNRTASSGEMVAISFLGKNSVKLFGQPTAGYTTANVSIELLDGSVLYLANSYTADRKGKVYRTKITPDTMVDSVYNESCIYTATKWLKAK